MSATSIPLTDRPPGAVLFSAPGREVCAAAFVADAVRAAASLPDRPHVANLCQDRYGFAVGLAAALLRGQVSLLSGDLSDGLLAKLAQDHPGAYALTDGDRDGARLPMPSHRIVVRPGSPAAGTPPAAPPPAAPPAIPEAQLAMIVLTSGTTGEPSRTAKTWGELVARSRAAGLRFAMTEDAPSAIVGTVPAGHMYGLETTVLLPLHAAASVWCGPAFYPADVAAALACAPGRATLVTTPLHLRALARAPAPGGFRRG